MLDAPRGYMRIAMGGNKFFAGADPLAPRRNRLRSRTEPV